MGDPTSKATKRPTNEHGGRLLGDAGGVEGLPNLLFHRSSTDLLGSSGARAPCNLKANAYNWGRNPGGGGNPTTPRLHSRYNGCGDQASCSQYPSTKDLSGRNCLGGWTATSGAPNSPAQGARWRERPAHSATRVAGCPGGGGLSRPMRIGRRCGRVRRLRPYRRECHLSGQEGGKGGVALGHNWGALRRCRSRRRGHGHGCRRVSQRLRQEDGVWPRVGDVVGARLARPDLVRVRRELGGTNVPDGVRGDAIFVFRNLVNALPGRCKVGGVRARAGTHAGFLVIGLAAREIGGTMRPESRGSNERCRMRTGRPSFGVHGRFGAPTLTVALSPTVGFAKGVVCDATSLHRITLTCCRLGGTRCNRLGRPRRRTPWRRPRNKRRRRAPTAKTPLALPSGKQT